MNPVTSFSVGRAFGRSLFMPAQKILQILTNEIKLTVFGKKRKEKEIKITVYPT